MSFRNNQKISYDNSYKEYQKAHQLEEEKFSSSQLLPPNYPQQHTFMLNSTQIQTQSYNELLPNNISQGIMSNLTGETMIGGEPIVVSTSGGTGTPGGAAQHHHHHYYYYCDQDHKSSHPPLDGFDEDEFKQSWFNKTYRSTWFQIIIVGALAFCGPAMADAISGLGGGGAADPWAVNAATSANYATSALVCLFGGPLASRFGVKTIMILGAATFPINGSSFYVNLKYHLQWYMVLGRAIGGFGSGLWYISESTIILTYPEDNRRGSMLAFWVMSRNLGQIVGGAISFGRNFHKSTGGAIATSTFLVFIAIEACGFPLSMLISPAHKVRRQDGTSIVINPPKPWLEEFKIVWKTLKSARSLYLTPYFFYSFFYGGVLGTYLTLNFSVRARALSSLIVPVSIVVFVFAFGCLLDYSPWSQRKRAMIAFGVVLIPTMASFTWLMVNEIQFTKNGHKKLDWTSSEWPTVYLPFLIMQISGYQCQTFIYWLLSCHADDVNTNARIAGIFRAIEATGQAVSYGLNSKVKTNIIPLAVNWGLFLIALPGCIAVISNTPKERVHDTDEIRETYED